MAVSNGYQAALMAPTEILAEQHHASLSKLLEPLGIRVGLLTGSLTPKNKSLVRESIAALQRAGTDIFISYWASRYNEFFY